MSIKELHIKNMVCPRCVAAVNQELLSMGARVEEVNLGYARIEAPENFPMNELQSRLQSIGFELLRDPEAVLVEEVKVAVQEYLNQIRQGKAESNLSDYVAQQIGKNYNFISKAFSRNEGKTVEKYFIALRIEYVKELIHYDEQTLSQIAAHLGYSNVHYLSNQFRKMTGMSVTEYKKLLREKGSESQRKHLDEL